MPTKAEIQIEKIAKNLGCSIEEATQIYADDCAIDKGAKMPWDLTKEQEKIAKKYTHTGTKTKPIPTEKTAPTVYKFDKRERKENLTKGNLIAELSKFMENFAESVEILNKERQISFKIGEDAFELTLVQKRKPKK